MSSRERAAFAIRKRRELANISARRLSIDSGLSPSYVSKVESGEIEPSFSAFAAIARSLNLTPLELIFCVYLDDNNSEAEETL